jgi:hypothetical protein
MTKKPKCTNGIEPGHRDRFEATLEAMVRNSLPVSGTSWRGGKSLIDKNLDLGDRSPKAVVDKRRYVDGPYYPFGILEHFSE